MRISLNTEGFDSNYPFFDGVMDVPDYSGRTKEQAVRLWVDMEDETVELESTGHNWVDYKTVSPKEFHGQLVKFVAPIAFLDRREVESLVEELKPVLEEGIEEGQLDYETIEDILYSYIDDSNENANILGERIASDIWLDNNLDDKLTAKWLLSNVLNENDFELEEVYEITEAWKEKVLKSVDDINAEFTLYINDAYIFEKIREILKQIEEEEED